MFLPIIIRRAEFALFSGPVSITFPPCTKYHEQFHTYWYVIWHTQIQIALFLILTSPIFLVLVSLVLRYKAEYKDKTIYKRAQYVLVLLIIVLFFNNILLSMNTARSRSIDASRRASISIRAINEIYYDEFGHYPIVKGSNAAERWSDFNNKLTETGQSNLQDDPCYAKTKDPYFQYDYRSSQDGSHYIAIALLQAPSSDDSGNLYSVYCVDNTGTSKAIDSIPQLDQFACSP